MNHVQAVTVVEASLSDHGFGDKRNGVTVVKRHVLKDPNNNLPQPITKESLNATVQPPVEQVDEEPEEYTLLGLVTFKSPIKWMNSISIILIHLIFIYGFITYPLNALFWTTFWGKFRVLRRLKKPVFAHREFRYPWRFAFLPMATRICLIFCV
jgi:hypothetical protein